LKHDAVRGGMAGVWAPRRAGKKEYAVTPRTFTMEKHDIGFGEIIVLREDIAEVVFNDGVHLDSSLVEEYHSRLTELLRAPFALLINKRHRYTYDPLARWKLGTFDKVNAFAIVAYDEESKAQSENTSYLLPREQPWNMRIFSDRQEALNWLMLEQSSIHGEKDR
jgi:hypothetical protein